MDAAAIRRAAIDAFHATWKLLEKADRTAAERGVGGERHTLRARLGLKGALVQ